MNEKSIKKNVLARPRTKITKSILNVQSSSVVDPECINSSFCPDFFPSKYNIQKYDFCCCYLSAYY